jgi:hypothetical protein
MNTPPELSKVPVGGKGQYLRGRPLVTAVAIVGVAVLAIAYCWASSRQRAAEL